MSGPGGRSIQPVRSLTELGAVLARACQAEAQVFELIGGWVRSVPEPEAKVLLSVHSRRHGAHAVDIAAVVPVVPGTGLPTAGLAQPTLEAMARLDTTVGRLTVLVDMALPELVAMTALPTAPTPALAEAPVTRALRQLTCEHDEQVSQLAAWLAEAPVRAQDRDLVQRELAWLKTIAGQELRPPASKLYGEPQGHRYGGSEVLIHFFPPGMGSPAASGSVQPRTTKGM